MLVTTHDPIGDFINAVSADMVCFASNRTYLELAHETEILNQLDSYATQLAKDRKNGT